MKKLLVIDDQEISREIVKATFGDRFDILEAADGLQGIKILRNNTDVSVILLDLTMPNMNGEAFLFARSMMDEVSDIPVVIISAEENQEIIDMFYNQGINAYRLKPLNSADLAETVENIIAKNLKFGKMGKDYSI